MCFTIVLFTFSSYSVAHLILWLTVFIFRIPLILMMNIHYQGGRGHWGCTLICRALSFPFWLMIYNSIYFYSYSFKSQLKWSINHKSLVKKPEKSFFYILSILNILLFIFANLKYFKVMTRLRILLPNALKISIKEQ